MEIFGITLWPDPDPDAAEFPEAARRRKRFFWGVTGAALATALLWVPASRAYHALRASSFVASAERFLATGDFASARIQLANAYRHDPARVRIFDLMAKVLGAEGSPEKAVCLARAFALAPHRADLAHAALQACLDHNLPDLGAILIPHLDRFPNDPEIAYLAAATLLQVQKPGAATSFLQRAARIDPANPRYTATLASLHLAAASEDVRHAARQRLETMRASGDPALHKAATRALAQEAARSDPAKAAALWDQIVIRNPEDRTSWLERLRAIRDTGLPRLRSDWDLAWGTATGPAERAELLRMAGAWFGIDLVEEQLRKLGAAARDPALLEVRFECLATRGQWDALAAASRPAAETSAHDGAVPMRLWLWTARAATRLQDHSLALLAVRNAKRAASVDTGRAFTAAGLLEEWGMPADAAGFYEAAARPGSPFRFESLRALARIHRAQGNLAADLDAHERLLQINPGQPVFKNNIAALLMDLDRDPKRALALAKEAAAAAPGADTSETLARAFARNGHPREALAFFEGLPADALGDASIRLHYAEALALAGRRADAQSHLDRVKPAQLSAPEIALLQRLQAAGAAGL